MKYFLDTRFIEGAQKENFPISLFRKNTPPTIDLISVGIVAEDGREYYAVSKDFNLKEAWNAFDIKRTKTGNNPYKEHWIRENVLMTINEKWWRMEYAYGSKAAFEKYSDFRYNDFRQLREKHGKTNKRIAEEILSFINSEVVSQTGTRYTASELTGESAENLRRGYLLPKFYNYYADYDWVAFCWLFGKMLEMPKGFPLHCNNLRQKFEAAAYCLMQTTQIIEPQATLAGAIEYIKRQKGYPRKETAHSALDGARWNKAMHGFLENIFYPSLAE